MIGVEPGDFFAVEEFWLDEREVERRERQRLETQHLAFGARDLPALDHDQIFDPDAPMPGMIKARLIREDHAGFERGGPELRNPLRPFVNG